MSAGLYIHIPFCSIQCGYCDFFTLQNRTDQFKPYLNSLSSELTMYSQDPRFRSLEFDTVFLGGGTPSLLDPADLSTLLDTIAGLFNIAAKSEITLEANPGLLSERQLRGFKAAGINRLSLGAQSFIRGELAFLDRDHTAADILSSIRAVRGAGFENISLDLIYGLPNQAAGEWQYNLEQAVQLEPDHISSYCLTFEPGTPLVTRVKQGKVEEPDDDVCAAMQLLALDYLCEHGYAQYEISNFARPGFESRHNLKYWNGLPYLGVGVSAHSFVLNTRFWNARNYKRYMDSLAGNSLPVVEAEVLTESQRQLERVFLGLRQRRGVSLRSFASDFGISFFERYARELAKHFSEESIDVKTGGELETGARKVEARYLAIEDGFLRLTRAGLPLCDGICAGFS